ncbi:gamma-glutamyl hydrolase-like isoform X2 [Sebastes umbrosus]|uniref:gamma-glutamyl hydrolase-like isoform X2 n=1 Tax=Sebastes umbrosus TaxID=72105 RepID=UPI00189F660E|nr:gamma-glutamyl hydrolase-like isoform X2 [Sebastes umbrosus]
MTAFQVLLALLLTAAAADGQSFHLGQCPEPSVQKDFNITKYMGTWYEIEKLPALFGSGKCIQATYSLRTDGTVKVRNAEVLSNGTINSIQGVARVENSSQPAILDVLFVEDIPGGPYWVLNTDYQSYSLVYSCSDYGTFYVDFTWILARTRVLTEDVIGRLHNELTSAGVNISGITVSDQTGCDQTRAKRNDRPIIGVLSQDIRNPKGNQISYIAASYVKTLESAGARVVPVMINQTPEEYKTLFNSINGTFTLTTLHNSAVFMTDTPAETAVNLNYNGSRILYPGGSASITSSGYQRAAKVFYDLAIEANKRGDYFPVFGTCLGYEQLTVLTSGTDLLSRTDTNGVPLPLNFTNEAKDSRMFKDVPAELMEELASEPLTANVHEWSLLMSTQNTNEKLKNFYKVLSTNMDGETEFVSTVEAYEYPIYGTQWHPEKNAFEWKQSYVPHSPSAVRTSYYMAEFFVNEARKNFHRFESDKEETKALIYNYNPVYVGPESVFEQIYYF